MMYERRSRANSRRASGVVSAHVHGFASRSPCIARVQARSRRNWPRAALAYRYAALLKLMTLAMTSTTPITRRRRFMSKLHDGDGEEEQQRTDHDPQRPRRPGLRQRSPYISMDPTPA